MLEDMPYCVLKEDERAYKIMLLRDQYENKFLDIAKKFEISTERARQIYYRIKYKQLRLYVQHISLVLGHENISQIMTVLQNAYECYQDWFYVGAYIEKKYKSILDEYRDGEPGMPLQWLQSIPPFKAKLSQKTVARVVEMREVEKATYQKIGEELHMTPAKARRTYQRFYHK